MTNEEIFQKVDEISKIIKRDNLNIYIKRHYPELYAEIESKTFDLNKFKKIKSGKKKIQDISIFERLYCIRNNLTDRPKCRVCGTEYVNRFIPSEDRYSLWCSIRCSCLDPETREKLKDSKAEKYGDSNYNNSEKARKTRYLHNNGQWHPCGFGDSVKKTKLERYGDENYINSEKRRDTMDRLLSEDPDYWRHREEKAKTTKLERYGDSGYNNRMKFMDTLSGFDQKRKKEILERRRTTNTVRYGYDYVLKDPVIRTRISNSNMERYGVKTCLMLESTREKVKITRRTDAWNTLENLKDFEPLFSKDDFVDITKDLFEHKFRWLCRKCGTEYEATYYEIKIHNRCPKCYPHKFGKSQNDVFEYVRGLNVPGFDDLKQEACVFGDGSRRRIDIYSDNMKFGIEYDGMYWHSIDNNANNDRVVMDYHIRKTSDAKSIGINLIHILDDEWVYHNKLCRGYIKTSLSCKKYHIDARKCDVRDVDVKEATRFIDKYSFEGEDSHSIGIGLYYHNHLVYLLTFSKTRNNKKYQYQILRRCELNNFCIVGGFEKVLRRFDELYSPESVVMYMNRRWFSEDDVMPGFSVEGLSKPNLSWFREGLNYGIGRINNVNYRRFIKECDEKLNITQNLVANGYMRFYDCGNLICVKRYNMRKDV